MLLKILAIKFEYFITRSSNVYQILGLNTVASLSITKRTTQHSSFPSPTPRLRGINGAERLVPKELLAEEELLLFGDNLLPLYVIHFNRFSGNHVCDSYNPFKAHWLLHVPYISIFIKL
jgi:hypothetical protein